MLRLESIGGKAGLSLKMTSMITKTWKMKDIWFKVSERPAATRLIKRLIRAGWEFQCGAIMDDGQVEGDDSLPEKSIDGQPTQEVQLYKI